MDRRGFLQTAVLPLVMQAGNLGSLGQTWSL